MLARHLSRHEVVCLDVWSSYATVVERQVPQVTLWFNRFHQLRHQNTAVHEVRRTEVRRLLGERRATIKCTRYILLKNP